MFLLVFVFCVCVCVFVSSVCMVCFCCCPLCLPANHNCSNILDFSRLIRARTSGQKNILLEHMSLPPPPPIFWETESYKLPPPLFPLPPDSPLYPSAQAPPTAGNPCSALAPCPRAGNTQPPDHPPAHSAGIQRKPPLLSWIVEKLVSLLSLTLLFPRSCGLSRNQRSLVFLVARCTFSTR